MVEDDNDLVGVMHLQNLAPRPLTEAEVDHHDEIDIDHREVTRRDPSPRRFSAPGFFR